MVLGLILALAGPRPVGAADEPLVPTALSGTFRSSPGGFFLCTSTPTSPVDTPDCFLGYVVPSGQSGQGRLRAVGSGFQRSSNFTVLEQVWVEPVAGGATTVFPVTAVEGALSRRRESQDVVLYGPPHPIGCFAYFTGPASGVWRMSHPHSAGRRRFEVPAVPARSSS